MATARRCYGPIPLGLCQCGCGQKTRVASRNQTATNQAKGRPMEFVRGHNALGYRKAAKYEARDCGYETPCWVWLGTITTEGYGSLSGRYAHRLMYEKHVGPIPTGLYIDHLCRNRACVNPSHLEPVTNAENAHRGARVKLTPEDVRAIRSASGTTRAIGARFGIDNGQVSRIRRRNQWGSVE